MNSTVVRQTKAATAAILVAGLALSLAACGTKEKSAPKAAPTTSAAPPPPPPPETWPLTGLPAPQGVSTSLNHPVYVVKIDNTKPSKPQMGLGSADYVTEELVEGGLTRLAVFFYSTLPAMAGPVRSMRSSDVDIVSPVNATEITSGGALPAQQHLTQAGITWLQQDNKYVVRNTKTGHDFLHSVAALLPQLAAAKPLAQPTKVPDYFTWGKEADFHGTAVQPAFSVKFSNSRTSQWSYANGAYTLVDNYFGPSDGYTPNTVVVILATTTLDSYKDPAGNPVPVIQFHGTGSGYVFHAGQVEQVTWNKNGAKGAVSFTDRTTGAPVVIPAGHVWTEMVGTGAGSVSYTPTPVASTPAAQ